MRILLLLLIILGAEAKEFTGTGEVKIIEPTETILAVCTPNEKYVFEPGRIGTIRLYVRNAMTEKTVNRVYIEPSADERFRFSYTPDFLLNLPPGNYSYFDLNVSIPDDMPLGDYRVEFLVGTDEHMIGSIIDEIIIRVSPYGDERIWFLGTVSVVILVLFVARFFWIRKVNSRKKHSRKR